MQVLTGQPVPGLLVPQHEQRVLHQRQRAGFVAGLIEQRHQHLIDIEPGKPRRLLDAITQSAPGDGRQEVAPAVAVVDGLQTRQRLEAVEKISAHRADDEKRAVRVLQRVGEQRIEALTGRRLGDGK